MTGPMTCQEIQTDAAGLAALPADDPDRAAAQTHARDCPACAAALAEGAAILSLLESAPAPPPPSAAVLARVRDEILADLTPAPSPASHATPATAAVTWRAWMAFPAAAVAAWAFLLLVSKHAQPRWGFSMAAMGIAVACALSARVLRGLPAIAAIVSAGISLAASSGAGLDVRVGLECVALELLGAAFPLAAAVTLVMTRRASVRWEQLSGIAAAGALAGQASLLVSCHVTAQSHHVVFHTGGVVLAALAGAIIAKLPMFRRAPAA